MYSSLKNIFQLIAITVYTKLVWSCNSCSEHCDIRDNFIKAILRYIEGVSILVEEFKCNTNYCLVQVNRSPPFNIVQIDNTKYMTIK